MDTARTANVEGMTTGTTETVITGIEIGTATETGTAGTTGVELLVSMVGVQEIMMITDALTMKIDAVIIDVTMNTVSVEGVVMTLVLPTAVVAGQGEEMASELLKEGLQHRTVLFRCLNENGKRRDGMFMPLAMNNIRLCRRSKQVSFSLRCNSPTFHNFDAGLFNLPGANRTQVPPILGIAGLPPPIPVQTFGMGIGSNPNLSRQSRRLYIGSITSDVNEQNLAEFFNSKMIEMSIGTGGPGNPVLAVQCNYEKNYAFVEVRSNPLNLNHVVLITILVP